MNKQQLEALIREILTRRLFESDNPVKHFAPGLLSVTEADRLDTGNPADRVYTHDIFSLEESPRLGLGLMVMEKTTFPWHLTYDEIDYVLEGRLTVRTDKGEVTAGPGEGILIPKDSQIFFSAPDHARFLYVTYPANWQESTG